MKSPRPSDARQSVAAALTLASLFAIAPNFLRPVRAGEGGVAEGRAARSQVAGSRAARASAAKAPQAASGTADWSVYGGQPANDHYSPLQQINRANASKLVVAWTFDTKETGGLETSPIIAGGTLYGYTPSQKVIALNAANGKLLWSFDSGLKGTQPVRGLTLWTGKGNGEGTGKGTGDRTGTGTGKGTGNGKGNGSGRLFAGVTNFLYALDPATGKPVESFGEHGRVDLRKNLRGDYQQQSIALTTPGVIYKNLIIVGGRNPETLPAPPGDIRAYDVRTGELRWAFHTIPHPGELGYETWPKDAWQHSGAANNWAGMAVDEDRGIVYAPTGSAAFDFYGGDRAGDDLFADTLLALDAATGKRLWHFQDVHHDIWDRDFPSPPTLLTVQQNGRRVDAVAQTTKQGYVYLFDRATGQSLFPIEERPAGQSDVPGEKTSATQPRPMLPEPFARQRLTEEMLTTRTPEAHRFALERFRAFHSDGQFVPFNATGQTIVFPGFDGGAEWGGSAVDTGSGVLYVNANEMAWTGGLTENKGGGTPGQTAYQSLCAVCHGENREGAPPAFPSLAGIEQRHSDKEIADIVHQGKGRMPGFPMLDDARMGELLDYLKHGAPTAAAGGGAGGSRASDSRASEAHDTGEKVEMAPVDSAADESKYRFTGYRKFLDSDGYPAIAPPWGTLSAIDLNTGKYLWKIPLGEYPELAGRNAKNAGAKNTGTANTGTENTGSENTGSENYGGPIVTAGGVVFIGATVYDRKFRAFDSQTGKLLWESALPMAGVATPATYMVDGKQYVVIAAGGGRDPKSPSGGVYVAFALP